MAAPLAAALLLALAWNLQRAKPRPGPLPMPPSPAPAQEVASWSQGAAPSTGTTLYLSPDCWVKLGRSARAERLEQEDGVRLRLEAGALALVNQGWSKVAVETPLGVLEAAPDAPLDADIMLGAPEAGLAFLLLREASAEDAPSLTVTVRSGRLRYIPRQRAEPTVVAAGQRARVAASGQVLLEEGPSSAAALAQAGPRVSQRQNPPLKLSGSPAALAFPALPATEKTAASGAVAWEAEVMAESSGSSLGMAFQAETGLRLWHLGALGAEEVGRWKRLRVVVRGAWAEGWVDGHRVMFTDHAAGKLQDAPVSSPSLVVWGEAQVRHVVGEAMR